MGGNEELEEGNGLVKLKPYSLNEKTVEHLNLPCRLWRREGVINMKMASTFSSVASVC